MVESDIDNGGWIALANNVFYRKKNGYVTVNHISTAVKGSANGTIIGTLPAAYRPRYMTLQSSFDGDGTFMQINTNGDVVIVGTSSGRCVVVYPTE